MKSCKRGVLCSFYILGADKQDYEYRTSLTHIFHQIGLAVLNLDPPLSQMFTTHHQRISNLFLELVIFSFFSFANLLAKKDEYRKQKIDCHDQKILLTFWQKP